MQQGRSQLFLLQSEKLKFSKGFKKDKNIAKTADIEDESDSDMRLFLMNTEQMNRNGNNNSQWKLDS